MRKIITQPRLARSWTIEARRAQPRLDVKARRAGGILSLLVISILPTTTLAQAAVDPAFNPSMLISDSSFSDVGTFGSADGIQKFLEQKGSVLANTSQDFLVKLKEPDTTTKVGLEDLRPNLGRLRTAAELIYDASTKHDLNPQVILVMLQKEQSLITGTFTNGDLQRALDRALGFGCPDYEGCGEIFLSFYRQLFGSFDSFGSRWLGAAASLMKSFNATVNGVRVGRGPGVDANNQVFGRPVVRTARVGDTIIIDNTLGGYAGVVPNQSVTMGNFATAALYRYTPHVFNGNYNFWKFFTTWFKYPNGTVIQKIGDATMYVIDNGTKRQFSALVAQQRKINTNNIITVSQTEFDAYPTEKPMTPLDGTLVKGDVSAAVFVISETRKRPVSYPVFVQRKYSFANIVTIPQAEVDSYEQGAFMSPVDGTLIIAESGGAVYQIQTELKRPISYDVFLARKYSFAKLMKLSDGEVTSIPTGPFLYPPDQTAVKLQGDIAIYWYRDGQKRFISYFVYVQRGIPSFPHLTLGQEEFNAIPTATPFPPKDGTVIKGDQSSAIYIMENGLKRLLTAEAYKRLRYPKATLLTQSEVEAYASGTTIEK